ncbi:MAG TPA: histidine kinase [Steroidobacteraceae bacterium]|nr:histidine kinase [Steroidobacteraceae bacterium]
MNSNSKQYQHAFHLPDFCTGNMTLAVVLIVELVALLLTTARQPLHNNFWVDLAGSSLFLLWQGLVIAAVLCRMRNRLKQIGGARAYACTLCMMLACSLIIAEVVYQIGYHSGAGLGTIPDIFPIVHGNFLLRTFAVAFIVSSLTLRYFHIAGEWRHSVELEAQARIRALQARIRPHFLFNSMNTIASLTRSDPQRAEAAVEDLADLFRANLRDARGHIPLQDELEIARIYQRIEQLRLGERLQVEWQVDTLPMQTQVPCLLIQPLLENAVYHGVEPLPDGGTIVIGGEFDGEYIKLSVSNPVASEQSSPGTLKKHSGNGIALDNIRQRLELAWPGRAQVELRQNANSYCVELYFPYQDKAGQE